MSGSPIESVKQGTILVGEMHKDRRIFKDLYVIPFDSSAKLIKYVDQGGFEKEISQIKGSGGTAFEAAFDIINFTQIQAKYEDVTVLFMTDGQTNHDTAIKALDKLKKTLKDQIADFRFFCLGFSAGHDANLLSQIARSGSDLGNFVYIADDSQNKYLDMKNACVQIFDLVPGSDSHKGTFVSGNFQKEL